MEIKLIDYSWSLTDNGQVDYYDFKVDGESVHLETGCHGDDCDHPELTDALHDWIVTNQPQMPYPI